jgi:hypothetical protein
MAREMPLEDRAGVRDPGLRLDGAAHQIEFNDPIDELEILEPQGLCRLRLEQTLDAVAEIAEDEILLGRGLAVIDLLGPLLQR